MVLTVGLALCVVYLVLPPGSGANALYGLVATGAVVALVAGARRHAGDDAARWYLLAAGIGLWVLGDWIWNLAMGETTALSVADVFYLAAYPILAVAFVLLARADRRGGWTSFVDSGIVAVGVGLLTWVVLFQGAIEAGGHTFTDIVNLAYPIGDVVLLGLLAGLVFVPGRRPRSYWLVVVGLAITLVADAAFASTALEGTPFSGRNLDVLWLAGYLLMAAAALVPSSVTAEDEARPREPSATRYIVVLALSALAGAAANVLELVSGYESDSFVWVAGTAVLAVLVAVRLAVLIRQGERLRGDLAAQNRSLRELDRLKDTFVATVSHELRTPLTSIHGYLELLLEGEAGDLTDEQRRFLGIIDRNSDRLLGLVGDLLFVAQVDAGGMHVEASSVDLASLACECVQSHAPGAEAREIELTLDAAASLPTTGDPKRLAQLLDNLVSNALKFTPPGGAVTVHTYAGPGAVVLEVEDSGMGIAPADQARLFDRFYRTATASDQAIQGTGLGLAIAKAIAEAHGGTISVTSAVGSGSTFRVVLPARARVEPARDLAAA